MVTPVRSQSRCLTITGTFLTTIDVPGFPQAVANSDGTLCEAATLDRVAAVGEADWLIGEIGTDAARAPEVTAAEVGDAPGAPVAAAPQPVRDASVTPSVAVRTLMAVGRRAQPVGSGPTPPPCACP